MKKALAILLCFALQIPIFSKWGVVAVFSVNQKEIIENFCVNKNRPQLHCDGHCYLAKQLKALEDQEKKSNSEKISHSPTIDLIDQFNYSNWVFFSPQKYFSNTFQYQNFYQFSLDKNIDAPPKV